MYNFLFQTDSLLTYFLVAVRIGGILNTAPVLGSSVIKPQIKMFLSITIAVLIFPTVQVLPLEKVDVILLVLLVLKELLIGVATGLVAQFLFVGVQLGGQIIGFQMGFGIVNVMDPQTNTQLSIIGQFKNIVMLLVFLAVGGHRLLMGAIAESFNMVPLGVFTLSPEAYFFPVKIFSFVFVTALKIVAPIFVTLLSVHVTMGIMGRLVPQLNLLIVGMPLQIAAGMSILAISLNYFYIVFEKIMHKYFFDIANIFKLFGG